MERVLVTGGNGFVGRHVMEAIKFHPQCDAILGLGRNISVDEMLDGEMLRCNLTDFDTTQKIVGDFKPTCVIHLAADPLTRHSIAGYTNNILGTLNILEATPRLARFVNMSSVSVYGDLPYPAHQGFRENFQVAPTSIYGASKVAAESLVDAYTAQERIIGVHVRPCAIVGENASHGLVCDLVSKLKSDDEYLRLIGGEPGTVKPFIHISDVASAITKLVFMSKAAGSFNLATIDPLSVKEVATLVMDEMDIHKPIKWEGKTWVGDNPFVRVEHWRAFHLLGWKPTYNSSYAAVRAAVRSVVCQNVC